MMKINPRIGWRNIGGKIVAFNCDNQKIVIWNEVAGKLWPMIEDGYSSNMLVKFLTNEYGISFKRARKNVLNFINETAALGLIKNHPDVTQNNNTETSTDGENALLYIEMEAIKKLIPFAVTFETTYSCNEKCMHCYMDKGLPSLKLKEIKHILKELAREGCLFISFTGGEFFTRLDALEIIKFASNLHFVIDILSNGVLINKNIAETLSKHSVRRVQISLYGATAQTHDLITRRTGSFNQTLRGIENLKNSGIKVEIAFPMMQINFQERYMVKKIADNLDCLISPNPIITARNNGSKDTYFLRLTDKQIIRFLKDKEFSALYAGRKPFQDHQFYLNVPDLLEAAPCYSGFNSCAITPLGKVFPCNQLLYEVGNLRKNSFSEIWRNSPQLRYLRGLKIKDLTSCSKCKNINYCSRCPGLAFLEGKNLLDLSPENCRITNITLDLKRKGGEKSEKNIHPA